ncbi:MAG TPA: dephospho-CoA kinase [Clostridia bacterium]|nr:dephospho-CoA kinase [Clostridia bacterium]
MKQAKGIYFMYKIAICGGIGTGKSEVIKILASKGYAVLSMDSINRELLSCGEYVSLIEINFPKAVVNGVIDKKILKNEIFNNESKRILLNKLSHPRIKNIFEKYDTADKTLLFVEVPLIVESNMVDMFDMLWAIKSPRKVRVERIINRDDISKELAEKIIDIQVKEETIYDIADIIISNDGDTDSLQKEVEKQLNILPTF